MLIGLLRPQPPYHFERTIAAARYYSVLGVTREGEYWLALREGTGSDENLALVRLASRGRPDAPEVEVHLMKSTGDVDHATLLRKVDFILGSSAEMTPFYELARQDTVLWDIVEPLYGLRHMRAATMFEALVTTIIEQQITLALAQRYERWLVGWGGNAIEYDGELFYTFPRPEQIARASLDELKPVKITTRRTQLLINLARRIVDREIDLEGLQSRPIPDVYDALVSLKGVGGWTAAWTIIRALGHYQYIGENDVALQAAVNHFFYQQKGKVTPLVVKETLGRYEEFAGTVAFYTLMRWAIDLYG
jgi:DNA-3-methyladenine glycosylase II